MCIRDRLRRQKLRRSSSPGIAIWALAGPRLDEYTDHIESQCRAHSKLVRFHQLRRQDIEAGRRPTVKSSLGRLGS
jgi:hypothetical protein